MKLTPENYYSAAANREYMSVSQYKAFLKCEAAAMAELNGRITREPTAAMMVGSYVDAYFEGTLDAFEAAHPELFRKDGSLLAPYRQAAEIIVRLKRDPLFMDYMRGEKQKIFTGTIDGVAVKIKMVVMTPERIVDGKVMRDFRPVWSERFGCRMPWFYAWGYDMQGGVYQEIVRQNIGKKLPFFLAAATKEPVTDYNVIEIVQADLDAGLDAFRENLARYDAIKMGAVEPERCECCDYCRKTKRLTAPGLSSDSTYDF